MRAFAEEGSQAVFYDHGLKTLGCLYYDAFINSAIFFTNAWQFPLPSPSPLKETMWIHGLNVACGGREGHVWL